ncbi:hypothetical protein A3D42_00695 [Candidatus Nomurabacteria bacterium RIFCSPHIGHO2_02_FULL_41_18]|uniref:Uncharacterized protein n=1 Tax=Candidatus Nomurabacteria bacterium RIFCSPHIGHO2_02_FULL_41_18 TaxID=1801754 RepID=A0A1F6W7M5_9BACT|nr:MAG: hypothetical protein A2737_03020 [Candidatus Nomurabacteria bacterium RIFCSPHIGHO2_01_FULL_41_71]OGI77802.1 MAG: hypothetical protein A3D42_00695 [Candidatus Nomurabacteria bacterium RIFCSPHIGHO2_02_FULL_41_18]OGI89931.1 MAG: hypothetical protein A3B01_01655 [Candidatus Nomurabacteria bacterium RIFCSPLOWO2_01_FULL_41_52b]OGJ00170.1 MAG: hypothetical protein A3I90_03005 [Candidatus Nomurabacteria bacterium RIFCSPLOWO2_02_FULL_41_9]
MKHLLPLIFILSFLISPVAVFADETILQAISEENSSSKDVREVFYIRGENDQIIAITQITDGMALGCSFSSASLNQIESTQTTSQNVPCVVWSLNEGQMVDEQGEGAGIVVGLLEARYNKDKQGRFISEDPIFLLVGDQNFEKKWNSNWRDIKQGNQLGITEYLTKPQSLNSYSYVSGNPLKYSDPTGEFEIHINFTTNIGLGGSGGSIWSLGFASDGSYGASTSWQAGGFAGGDVSVGAGIGYSNAKTWNNTQGKNNYVGAGGKLILGADAGLNFSKDGKLNGADISGGIGLSSPLYMKGGMGETTILMSRSIKQDVQNIGKGISNAVGSVKEGVGKVINKLIK